MYRCIDRSPPVPTAPCSICTEFTRTAMQVVTLWALGVQGVILMAAATDSPGATTSKAAYQQLLAAGAKQWADCSNDGEAVHGDGNPYCMCACPFSK